MRARRPLLLAGCLMALLPAAAAHAAPGQRTLFEAPREMLSGDEALRNQTFDEIQRFGVSWMRVILYWRDVAPQPDARSVPSFDETDPAGYDWSRYDAILREAERRRIRVLLTVSGPVPRWATRYGADHVTEPSRFRFRRFMLAAGRRYGDIIDHWAIWNEPNHPDFLQPQVGGQGSKRRAVSPRVYRGLFQMGYKGLGQAGQGRDTILMGETAPQGGGQVLEALSFLRGALCLDSRYRKRRSCGKLPADGYAHHAYTRKTGPYYEPDDRDAVTIGVLSRLNSALARAAEAGAVRKGMPIWLTEFGIQSRPDPFYGVSEQTQAEYIALSERIAWRNQRVVAYSQYLMRDDDPRTDGPESDRYGGFESGLRYADGRAKRAYDAFPVPLVAHRSSSGVALWGIVRPGSGARRPEIDYRNRGSSTWRRLKSDTTTSRGDWSTRTSYRRGRVYRVRFTAADGTVYTGPATRVRKRP